MTPTALTDIDPFRPGFLVDPWRQYERMRAAGPVIWHTRLKAWFVVGHAEAASLLGDESFRVGGVRGTISRLGERSGKDFSCLLRVLNALPFFRDPPAHGLLRRAAVAAFADRPLASYAPELQALARGLLEPARSNGGFDAVLDFAELLPPLFITRLLGIPEADLPALRSSNQVLRALNRVIRLAEYESVERTARAHTDYFLAFVKERRRAPGNDGISRMIAAEHQGRRLADDELASLCVALYLVSVETTSTLIGSAIRTLTDLPALQSELRADPALLKPAVDELLRYESPVQSAFRSASVPRRFGGQDIAPGETIVVLLGAANRDGSAWSAPAEIDFRRRGPAHLAFGEGAHQCVGAALARLEAQSALGAWLELPACRRAAEQDAWWDNDWLRRLRKFPVELRG
jgi:cytochrome P450